MALSALERETIINASDGDEVVRIWTAQRATITRLRNHEAFAEVGSGTQAASPWAEFAIPADRWTPLGVKRKVTLSDEERKVRAERLARRAS